ncbi:MAG: Na+/H+ antiporter subunit C [Gammaproteobacteria bacterium]|nr:MAG: Na+/H+ antiporter subunit C [Gammaproteobacteria bacterium]
MNGVAHAWLIVALMMSGLYIVMASAHLFKKLIGLSVFQVSVFMLYISLGVVEGAAPPIVEPGVDAYSNPLPHVLILTAIVVGIATMALALALLVRIRRAYGTLDEAALAAKDEDA